MMILPMGMSKMTDCPVCQKRQADERKQLEECNSRCKESQAKNQRLSIVLAVVGTLVGKETLDRALGLADLVGDASVVSAAEASTPAEVAFLPVENNASRPWNSNPPTPLVSSNVLFANVPPLLTNLTMQPTQPVIDYFQLQDTIVPGSAPFSLFYYAFKPSRKRPL